MFQDIRLYQSTPFNIADATTHLGSISYDFNKSSKLLAILTQCSVGQSGAKTPNPVLKRHIRCNYNPPKHFTLVLSSHLLKMLL